MRSVRWMRDILIIVLMLLFISGSIWADEKEKRYSIEVSKELVANSINGKLKIFPQHYKILSSKLSKCNNNYLITASLFDESNLDSFSKIINIDNNGNVIWEKILGRKAPDNWISKLVCIPSQKYFALLGTVNYKFYYGGKGSGWVVILSENGSIIWDKEFKKGRITHINDGLITDDGSLMLIGNIYGEKEEGSFINSFLIKLDINGQIVFSKDYPMKISFIKKISTNKFLIGNLSKINGFLGIIDNNGNLNKYVDLNYSFVPENIKVIIIDKKLLIVSMPQREQLLVEFFNFEKLDKPFKKENLLVKDLCSLLDFKEYNNEKIVFSGISCNNKLNIKVLKLSFTNDTIDIEIIKDINFKPIVNKGELLDADYNGDVAIGILDNFTIWVYTRFFKHIE